MVKNGKCRLILVSGACPGAGKSTLAAAVARRLADCGLPHRLLSEDDLLRREPFARCDDELGRNDPHALDSFLDAARALAAEVGGSEAVTIADALLPGFVWLLGRYPPERVERYRDALASAVLPTQPLLIHLTGDVHRLFARAVAQRGLAFQERIVRAVQRWSLPHYPGAPPRELASVLALFDWLNDRALELLADWPGSMVVLDATDIPTRDLATTILRRLIG